MAESELYELCKRSLRINRFCNLWLSGDASPIAALIGAAGCVSWRVASSVARWMQHRKPPTRERLARILMDSRPTASPSCAPLGDFLVRDLHPLQANGSAPPLTQLDFLCLEFGTLDDCITRICASTTSMPLLRLLVEQQLNIIDALSELLRWQDRLHAARGRNLRRGGGAASPTFSQIDTGELA